jgi:hypothetical protein
MTLTNIVFKKTYLALNKLKNLIVLKKNKAN